MRARQWIAIGALWAGIAVALGAFGAHALKEELEEAGQLANWHTAVRYQMWHALALILFGVLYDRGRVHALAGWAFLVGSFLFSGSIYCLTRDVLRPLMGPITPIGGLFLLVGWVVFAASVLRGSDGD